MADVLVVDDEPDVLNTVGQIVEDAGHVVRTASGGKEALELMARRRPDVLVLDIIMPMMSGEQVCRQVRSDPFLADVPILFLTAKGRPDDVVRGLDAGGDDYLVKPFQVVELAARIRALLRRAPGGEFDAHAEFLEVGNLRLHPTRWEVQVGDELVELRPTEHRLLYYLMRHAGQPMAASRLLEEVWEYPPGTGDAHLVEVHISNLRKKIELGADARRIIRNVRGRGYLISE